MLLAFKEKAKLFHASQNEHQESSRTLPQAKQHQVNFKRK